MVKIDNFDDYKAYVMAFETSRRNFERGFRTKLAEHLKCQSGYISQVLNGSAHFSLEQGIRTANFFKLNQREKKYFLLLIEKARAGTKELQQYFEEELRHQREEFLNIKERVGSRTLSEAQQSIYYSSWHYLAIHILTSIEGFHDAKTIGQSLRLPESLVGDALIFLLEAGILQEKNGRLIPGMTLVHLNKESPLIRQHHTNLRVAAIQSLTSSVKNDIHYSTISSLSKLDAQKLQLEMVQFIERYVETIKPSKEETLYAFNLDFFKMI